MSEAGTRLFEGVTIPDPGTFVLDPYHTRIGFVARHLMVSKVRGRFGEFTGSITIAENPLESSAEAVIKTASVDTGVEQRDADLKSENFLNAEKDPEMIFRTTGVTGHDGPVFQVLGELTIKDQTHPVELELELEGILTKPEMMGGQQTLGFTLTGEIDREDWGITYNMALEAGGFVVSKKVRLEIEGEAVRQA
jgi:polyisoprenoid-binding protein YceI